MKLQKVLILLLLIVAGKSNAKEAPKTLFELSGGKRPEIIFKDSTLIIIDAQQEYSKGRLPLDGLENAVYNIKSLLSRARKLGIPIIHVVQIGSRGGLFDPQTSASEILPGLEPRRGEPIISKSLPNGFQGTSLLREVEKAGKNRKLILVGFMTHMCVTATAMGALEHGLQGVVVTDAVATRDLRGPHNEIIPAAQMNRASLATIQDRIAWLVDTQNLIR